MAQFTFSLVAGTSVGIVRPNGCTVSDHRLRDDAHFEQCERFEDGTCALTTASNPGWIVIAEQQDVETKVVAVTCTHCHGVGKYGETQAKCYGCRGKGVMTKEDAKRHSRYFPQEAESAWLALTQPQALPSLAEAETLSDEEFWSQMDALAEVLDIEAGFKDAPASEVDESLPFSGVTSLQAAVNATK